MAGRMQKKMHDTTNYQGRSVEMNVSKNKFFNDAKQKENSKMMNAKNKRR